MEPATTKRSAVCQVMGKALRRLVSDGTIEPMENGLVKMAYRMKSSDKSTSGLIMIPLLVQNCVEDEWTYTEDDAATPDGPLVVYTVRGYDVQLQEDTTVVCTPIADVEIQHFQDPRQAAEYAVRNSLVDGEDRSPEKLAVTTLDVSTVCPTVIPNMTKKTKKNSATLPDFEEVSLRKLTAYGNKLVELEESEDDDESSSALSYEEFCTQAKANATSAAAGSKGKIARGTDRKMVVMCDLGRLLKDAAANRRDPNSLYDVVDISDEQLALLMGDVSIDGKEEDDGDDTMDESPEEQDENDGEDESRSSHRTGKKHPREDSDAMSDMEPDRKKIRRRKISGVPEEEDEEPMDSVAAIELYTEEEKEVAASTPVIEDSVQLATVPGEECEPTLLGGARIVVDGDETHVYLSKAPEDKAEQVEKDSMPMGSPKPAVVSSEIALLRKEIEDLRRKDQKRESETQLHRRENQLLLDRMHARDEEEKKRDMQKASAFAAMVNTLQRFAVQHTKDMESVTVRIDRLESRAQPATAPIHDFVHGTEEVEEHGTVGEGVCYGTQQDRLAKLKSQAVTSIRQTEGMSPETVSEIETRLQQQLDGVGGEGSVSYQQQQQQQKKLHADNYFDVTVSPSAFDQLLSDEMNVTKNQYEPVTSDFNVNDFMAQFQMS